MLLLVIERMRYMFDVIALGELLIDFTSHGFSENGSSLFEQNPGGAPANVLVSLSKLGINTAFLGMVGKDQFGLFLKNVLNENNVNSEGLKFSETVNTTLAFVHLEKDGDRVFSFYRNPGADMMLRVEDINFDFIKNSKIFHFGSLSLTAEPARSATLAAVTYAKENGLIISYDPNLRPLLWSNLDSAKQQIMSCLKYADILKISEEEFHFITGLEDLDIGTEMLYNKGISIILITLGEEGCYYRYKGGAGRVKGYKVNSIDTTGAGDGFLGGVLFNFCNNTLEEIKNISKEDFENVIKMGNAVGALVTTKKGAIPSMPMLDEINDLILNS
jgi:fructokinase